MTTILVTASGAPGAARLLRGLRENGERDVRLVGVDMSERSIGRFLTDAFHVVPPGADPGYADAILDVVERESVDVVLPESSHDLPHLAAARDRFPVPVLVSGPVTVQRSNDKAETYALLHRIGVRAPEFRRVDGAAGVEDAAKELGYPDRCASSRSSRRGRGAFASSTRRSTGRTSSSTSGPVQWRCASRRRSSSCPRTAPTCW
jgi:carbamoyl-phosphate synthase large subunit